MRKFRNTMITLTILIVISLSFSSMLGLAQNNLGEIPVERSSITSGSIPSISEATYQGSANYSYGLNATAVVNRTVEIQTFGILSLVDSIELNVIGNETLIYFNYTLPNINTENITFVSFRVSNASYRGIGQSNATRIYTFQKFLNYTTFTVPFNVDLTSIGQDAQYFINIYIEFAYPYEVSLEADEQLLHYQELIYPLLNNIPISGGLTWVQKQGGDVFIDDETHVVTPLNGTNEIYYEVNADQGLIKWKNITRHPFNYTQSYEDDLLVNVYLTSVSAGGDIENPANTMLFKATEINRKIEIDPYGLIIVTEEQNILYVGPDKPEDYDERTLKLYALNSFPVIFPENATVLDLYDELGSLNQAYQLNEQGAFEPGSYNQRPSVFPGHDALVIFPRTPLFKGDTLTITLVYKVPMEVFLQKEEGSINYKLKVGPCSIINWTVDQLNLDIYLPKGAVVKATQYNNPDPYQDMIIGYDKKFDFSTLGFKRILSFTFTRFSGSDNAPLIISYSYSKLNVLITFFLQTISVGVVFAIYLGIRWSTRRTADLITSEADKEFIPIDEIEEFVKQYEEILSLRERLRETRQKLASKKMKVKEGKELIAKFEKRLRAEEESLRGSKEALIKKGGSYKSSVQKIEISERRLTEERRNLRSLQQEYRTKKSMTKESYMKLYRERQQSIEKLKNDIDGHLVGLRMLLEP